MLIKIDTDQLPVLAEEGGKLVFDVKAEDAIVKLLELEALVAQAKEAVKQRIEAEALKHNPNFTSVQGDRVKVGYRAYGGKYTIDEARIGELPEELYKTRVVYTPDTKAVDAWAQEKGALPLGIVTRPRAKQISIKLLEAGDDE
jgi:hypothetical protein